MEVLYTPGSRIQVRDALWRIKRVDQVGGQGSLLTCDGLSELVNGREARFWTTIEPEIRVLDPARTELVEDTSGNYRASRLYLDTLMSQSLPGDPLVYVGHRAAMDVIPFQLEPAVQALEQPRARILIADSVGLGKTLEAAILTSELIARGRGRRILVLAVKSMLTQFQQEFWSRFSIGLTRLDSQGLQRVRHRIPGNHNPFHYFDRSIISIDTLKQDIEYRHYLERAYWDIIIIDEAHNVAERGSGSQRARLANLLSRRSDTLIMLSATPHDGKPESFASLMNMLDPTAIADPSDYASEDFSHKGLVVRRFKHDVREQLKGNFPERRIATLRTPATAPEEHLHEVLAGSRFSTLRGTGGAQLFATNLSKALFSSPAALISMVDNRLRRLQNRLQKEPGNDDLRVDIDQLNAIRSATAAIGPDQFAKFGQLVSLLKEGDGDGFDWQPSQADDRLVIFTESIATLSFLAEHLPRACRLRANQVAVLRGDMPDADIMGIIDQFNQRSSPLRLLLCSDVASEGINLHHLSHKMVHFDIPWSLMVFQQRNGRIDRYGQTRSPQIRYLLTTSEHPGIRGDKRVLEVLVEKDRQAGKNIGDPSEFSQEEGEALTAQYMEREPEGDQDVADLLAAYLDGASQTSSDAVAAFTAPQTRPRSVDELTGEPSRLFPDDMAYAREALHWLMRDQGQELQADVEERIIRLTANMALRQRRNEFPREAWPEDNRFVLTDDIATINSELVRARGEEGRWPQVHYLWALHPDAAPVFRSPLLLCQAAEAAGIE